MNSVQHYVVLAIVSMIFLLVVLCRMMEVKVRNVPRRLLGWVATRLRCSVVEGELGTEQRERVVRERGKMALS